MLMTLGASLIAPPAESDLLQLLPANVLAHIAVVTPLTIACTS